MTRFLEYTPHQPELMMAGAPDPEQAGRYRELARRSSPGAIIPEPVPAAPPVVRLTPAQLAIVRARASDRGADVGCILCRRIVQAIDGDALRDYHDGDGALGMSVDAQRYHIDQEMKGGVS